MKPCPKYRSLFYFALLFLFLAVHPVHAQSESKNPIVGSWIFDTPSSFNVSSRAVTDLVEANPDVKSRIRSAYIGKTLTFSPDGSYAQVLGTGKRATGKWSLDGDILYIATEDGTVFRFGLKFAGDRLLLHSLVQKQGYKSLMPNQFFTKIE